MADARLVSILYTFSSFNRMELTIAKHNIQCVNTYLGNLG
jgi:hypothetical protein